MAQHRSFILAAGIGALLGSTVAVAAQDMPPGSIPGRAGQSTYRQPYQPQYQQPQAPYSQPYQHKPLSKTCVNLERQLSSIEQGTQDPDRAAKIQRYEDAIDKQQAELDRTVVRLQKIGCENSGFFSLFHSQPAACEPLKQKVRQMRDNVDRMMVTLQQLQGNTADRESQRRSVIIALGENNCGPQYRTAVTNQQHGIFESLFGPGTSGNPTPESNAGALGSTYTTICVRSCDGYYWPISFSTVPSHFAEDARTCQRMCPEAQVSLYTFHNPGETVDQAMSLAGQPYTALPTAFSYRTKLNPACACRQRGESWAHALGVVDNADQPGDVSTGTGKPSSAPGAAQSKSAGKNSAATAKPGKTQAQTQAKGTAKHTIRNVGPTFLPSH